LNRKLSRISAVVLIQSSRGAVLVSSVLAAEIRRLEHVRDDGVQLHSLKPDTTARSLLQDADKMLETRESRSL